MRPDMRHPRTPPVAAVAVVVLAFFGSLTLAGCGCGSAGPSVSTGDAVSTSVSSLSTSSTGGTPATPTSGPSTTLSGGSTATTLEGTAGSGNTGSSGGASTTLSGATSTSQTVPDITTTEITDLAENSGTEGLSSLTQIYDHKTFGDWAGAYASAQDKNIYLLVFRYANGGWHFWNSFVGLGWEDTEYMLRSDGAPEGLIAWANPGAD
jgi:hypothetical protein